MNTDESDFFMSMSTFGLRVFVCADVSALILRFALRSLSVLCCVFWSREMERERDQCRRHELLRCSVEKALLSVFHGCEHALFYYCRFSIRFMALFLSLFVVWCFLVWGMMRCDKGRMNE